MGEINALKKMLLSSITIIGAFAPGPRQATPQSPLRAPRGDVGVFSMTD